MKKNCIKCHTEVEQSQLNYRMECSSCERKRKDDEDDDDRRRNGILTGDMLNTGIPGGIDMDFTTPW